MDEFLRRWQRLTVILFLETGSYPQVTTVDTPLCDLLKGRNWCDYEVESTLKVYVYTKKRDFVRKEGDTDLMAIYKI